MKKAIALTVLVATVALTGCAPTDFVQPGQQKITLGESTYEDVLRVSDHNHPPKEVNIASPFNGKTLHVVSYTVPYVYSKGEDSAKMTIQRRSENYLFYNNVLIGMTYDSTFNDNSTEFDEDKAAKVKVGMTKQQVISLVGKPSGRVIYPAAKNPGDTGFLYEYTHGEFVGVFATRSVQELMVSFDGNGIVDDIYLERNRDN
ncbi:outer membrane protein assembly factor BamE [Ferrovum sp.]|uniref:outer membrane protein assembly factor BamE domain-containing protein n=1 Tax=Ferrovum sp. TaxID=2609467 RepID=UPI002617D61A|nr:outer membrane protein assembly factor BamE [Ferrovum sp.]